MKKRNMRADAIMPRAEYARTLREIADELGVSVERVRFLEESALRKLAMQPSAMDVFRELVRP